MAREAPEDRYAGLAPAERLMHGAPPALDLAEQIFSLGETLPERRVGELFVRSDCMLTEYYRRPDLAPLVGADLSVMERDAKKMRGDGPTIFAQVKNDVGVDGIVDQVLATWKKAVSA